MEPDNESPNPLERNLSIIAEELVDKIIESVTEQPTRSSVPIVTGETEEETEFPFEPQGVVFDKRTNKNYFGLIFVIYQ